MKYGKAIMKIENERRLEAAAKTAKRAAAAKRRS
jgi:hypothetical protein